MNRYILSSIITFVASFFVVLGQTLLTANPPQWTAAVVFSIILSVVRTMIVKPAGETIVGVKA